ncbi:MAG: LPXTG cell wall anchor domain-containing protein [Lactobacillus sp.]|jgi:LPXTG-motif cell wall-anchored protein|nr:LPXTG cell wall anchor domain-containing protein [Lactobacillus sp.]MCI2033465.1 LPXTG cell wall anchor domain-containing protein [Lactobacillus sp.]
MNKKWVLGSTLLAGAVLVGLAGQPQEGVHADEQTPTTAATGTQPATATPDATSKATQSQVPAGQTVKTTGTNDTITPADANTTNYKNVGENSKVMVVQQYDEDGNLADMYKASAINRDAFTGDNAPASTEGVDQLDAQTIMNGDTTHYGEYVNGSWQVNSLTMQGGHEVADRQSFDLDVTPVASDAEVTHDYTVADGVNVHVGKSEHSQELNDQYGNKMVTGTYLTVSIYGQNVFDDNHETKVGDENGLGQIGFGFVNVPFTFHYYNTEGGLVTGTLNFINGIKANTSSNNSKGTNATGTPEKGTVPATGANKGAGTPTTATADHVVADKEMTTTAVVKTGDSPKPVAAATTPVKVVAKQTGVDKTATKPTSLPQAGDHKSSLGMFGVALLALIGVGGVTRKRRA